MDIKAKLRPFYVAKMLYERTDEEHYLTIAQMMEILKKEYGISTSRGTVSDDVKVLQEFGLESLKPIKSGVSVNLLRIGKKRSGCN